MRSAVILATCSILVATPTFGASSAPVPAPSRATPRRVIPKPGARISAGNLRKYFHVVPLALASIIRLGHSISVTPTETIAWPPQYKNETEKYAPQVRLDRHEVIQNYVTGLPFPVIDSNDPHAAVKVAYNWRYGPFVPDDFTAHNAVDRFYRQRGISAAVWHDPDEDVSTMSLSYLRYAHRTTVDPVPSLPSNPQSVEAKVRSDGLHGPIYTADAANIWIRFLDPTRPDAYYRLNRLFGTVRLYDSKYQGEFFGWRNSPSGVPKTSLYTFRLLGTATILGCVAAKDNRADETSGPLGFVTNDPFQLRRVYVVQSRPKDPKWGQYLTIYYIDTESYLELAGEYYKGSKLTGAGIDIWRRRDVDGPFYLAAGIQYLPSGAFYLTGGFGNPESPSSSSSSFYIWSPGSGGSLDTGNISTSIFNPASLRWSSPE